VSCAWQHLDDMAGGPSPPIAPLCPRRRRRRAMRTCACPTLRA